MVQELDGPVTGLVSQNWVWRRVPPGELKQQLGDALDWQLIGPLAEQTSRDASAPVLSRALTAREEMIDRRDMLI